METKKKKRPGVTVGSSLILVTFVLLCLIAFAALSYVSANADYELSKQTAEKTTAYYNAVEQAEQTLSDINNSIKTIAKSSTNDSVFTDSILLSYNKSDIKAISYISPAIISLSLSIPIDEKTAISIILHVKSWEECRNGTDICYEIIKYETVTTAKPENQTISGDGTLMDFDDTDN